MLPWNACGVFSVPEALVLTHDVIVSAKMHLILLFFAAAFPKAQHQTVLFKFFHRNRAEK